jgi:preprotein translocase subunit SecE
MWGFKSLLPCQHFSGAVETVESAGTRAVDGMAQAAKLNREEEEHRVSGFSLMSPVGKVSESFKRLGTFFHDVRVEMKQVNWPSRLDVWSTTIVVIVTVGFFALFFFMTDSLLSKAEDWLFHFVKR